MLTNEYINSVISKSFLPVITMPTRITHQSATLIDHIWTNKVCSSYHSGIIINSLSEHFPVIYIEQGEYKKVDLQDKITRSINKHTIPAFCNLLKSSSCGNVIHQTNREIAFKNSLRYLTQLEIFHFS